MALVVVCGQPCSGKTSAVRILSEALSDADPKATVRIIDESAVHPDRSRRYADMRAEKNLRGMLRSEVDRSVSRDAITVVDSLNNIKGYRYELWCLARAAGTLYCVLHCDVRGPQCREWNTARRAEGGDAYPDAVLDDLLARFESPDGRNRWDSPLFELRPSAEAAGKGSAGIVDAVRYLTRAGGAGSLRPTAATRGASVPGGNSRYEMDRATLDVVEAVAEGQRRCGGSPGGVRVGDELPMVNVPGRTVGLPELRRLRRTFLKLAGQPSLTGAHPPTDPVAAKRMFVDYLNRELETV